MAEVPIYHKVIYVHNGPPPSPPPKVRPAHRDLTTVERERFRALYSETEARLPVFRYLNASETTKRYWVVYFVVMQITMVAYVFRRSEASCLQYLFLYALGVLSLQMDFVILHIRYHSQFLEYDAYVPGRNWTEGSVVHLTAFYHHHHSKTDDWMPEISGYTERGRRAILLSHWHDFSIFLLRNGSVLVPLVCLWPTMVAVAAGYEMGVFLLPIAHGYQHTSAENLGVLATPIEWLSKTVGLIADRGVHIRHHDYSHRCVYQGFTSSGIYAEWLDRLLDHCWNIAFEEAVESGVPMYKKLIVYDALARFGVRVSWVLAFILVA